MLRRYTGFKKNFPKIITASFVFLIVLQTSAFLFFTFFYTPTEAESKWVNPTDSLQIKIPGMKRFSEPTICPDDPTKTCIPWLGEYLAGIYNYAMGIVGILAAVVLMFGGVLWLTAGGSSDRINEAKAWIGAALSGLILALCSYMILYQINPELVKSNPLKITVAKEKSIKGSGWSFDQNIERQVGDCSPALFKLLACMREKLPAGVGRISSISDSNYVGNPGACYISGCKSLNPPCVHLCNSCHYGGGIGDNKSHAVDFGDQENKAAIIAAAAECGGSKLDEGDHIHVSTEDCPNL